MGIRRKDVQKRDLLKNRLEAHQGLQEKPDLEGVLENKRNNTDEMSSQMKQTAETT